MSFSQHIHFVLCPPGRQRNPQRGPDSPADDDAKVYWFARTAQAGAPNNENTPPYRTFGQFLRGFVNNVLPVPQDNGGAGENQSNNSNPFVSMFNRYAGVRRNGGNNFIQMMAQFEAMQRAMVAEQERKASVRPASKNAIRGLAERALIKGVPLPSDLDGETCSVCLCNFAEGDKVHTIHCGHHFHKDCLGTWLKENNTCPVCRFELLTDDAKHNEKVREAAKSRGIELSSELHPHKGCKNCCRTPSEGKCGHSAAVVPEHKVGDHVIVQGLLRQSQHNGEVGVVLGHDHANGRYSVRLPSRTRPYRLRAQNLARRHDPEGEAATTPEKATVASLQNDREQKSAGRTAKAASPFKDNVKSMAATNAEEGSAREDSARGNPSHEGEQQNRSTPMLLGLAGLVGPARLLAQPKSEGLPGSPRVQAGARPLLAAAQQEWMKEDVLGTGVGRNHQVAGRKRGRYDVLELVNSYLPANNKRARQTGSFGTANPALFTIYGDEGKIAVQD